MEDLCLLKQKIQNLVSCASIATRGREVVRTTSYATSPPRTASMQDLRSGICKRFNERGEKLVDSDTS